MSRSRSIAELFLAVIIALVCTQPAWADAFAPPRCGGWAYSYEGDTAAPGTANHFDALDGTWSFTNGSSAWDQTVLGTGSPGGVGVVTDGGTTYLRMQDTGDPQLYGYTTPANQKFFFGHDVSNNIGDQAAASFLDEGMTFSFRARLSTPAAGGPLDQTCPSPVGTRADWPAGGDGYLNGGFAVGQVIGDAVIRFSLALATDMGEGGVDVMGGKQGLVMNRLKGTTSTKKVRPYVSTDGGTMNILEIADLTVWHEFWITIRRAGAGTHQVTVYLDGSTTPAGTFDVTASNESDYNTKNYVGIGMPATTEGGAVDLDFLRLRAGAMVPLIGPCFMRVLPDVLQTATAVQGFPVAPITYTLTNCDSPGTVTYNIAELDENQVETDVPWLSLSNTSGSLAVGQSDTVVVSFDSSVAQGLHHAFLKITDSCSPANVQIRPVDLNLLRWAAEGCDSLRGYLLEYPSMPIETVTCRIKNAATGAPITYTVVKSATADWAVLSSSTGNIPAGGEAVITVTFNTAGLTGDMLDAVTKLDLTFSSTADANTYSYRIRFRYMNTGVTPLFVYDGTVHPQDADSSGDGLRFGPVEDDDGVVEPDPDAQNHYALHITDPAGYSSIYQTQVYDAGTATWEPHELWSEFGGTILARVKVTSWSVREGGNLFAWDSDTGTMNATVHWGGADGGLHELVRDVSASATGTGGYVLLRMTVKGRDGFDCDNLVSVYLNENPVPVLQIPNASSWSQPLSGLGFGAGSDACIEDMWFDWVTATRAGAFAPGEEVATLGRSLIPEFCHVPFADADRDGDIDLADFAVLQRCITIGGGAVSTDCKCFDRPEVGFPRGDGVIDLDDLLQFERCATGPNVPFDLGAVPPGCQP